MLGDHWHSEEFKGKTPEQEVNDKIKRYKAQGVDCLIIWEHELKDKEIVTEKIRAFNNNVNLDLSHIIKQREQTRGMQLAFF
jgi:phosphoribosylformimino-5-aminoimidazole carboxamide ribonucleotide (ProFAR) isomerase